MNDEVRGQITESELPDYLAREVLVALGVDLTSETVTQGSVRLWADDKGPRYITYTKMLSGPEVESLTMTTKEQS
ncbi:hypothetical protein [Microbacterium sp. zg.B96]|uniref:hypothetical protein n=1 Tax=Microbacterium sp. zg.B96 TaxID=2969409 RepID=UPI00214BE3F2|nr:hypothetical protein [Microbacterium sp. zg.B96]